MGIHTLRLEVVLYYPMKTQPVPTACLLIPEQMKTLVSVLPLLKVVKSDDINNGRILRCPHISGAGAPQHSPSWFSVE